MALSALQGYSTTLGKCDHCYDMVKKFVCMPDVQKLPDEFEDGNNELMDYMRANLLVLTRSASYRVALTHD